MLADEYLRVVKRVRGARAISSLGQPLGRVTDVVVHPTQGRWLGLLVENDDGVQSAVPADGCDYARNIRVVTISDFALTPWSEFAAVRPDSARVCQQLIGARVISEPGELLGYVSEVSLQPVTHAFLYHVAVADWRRWFRLGFYLAGDAPRFFSSFGARLIVPANPPTLDVITGPDGIRVNR